MAAINALVRSALLAGAIAGAISQSADGARAAGLFDEHLASWPAELRRLRAIVGRLPDDVARTTFLREYTGALLDVGRLSDATRQRYRALDFATFDPAEFYPLFRANLLAADCGITTFFYLKLLDALGFNAYQYSFGFTEPPYERFIHSVVMVRVTIDGEPRLIIQDPYLNLMFRGRDGAPLDVLEFLALLRRGDYQAIAADRRTVTTALIMPNGASEPWLTDECRERLARALAAVGRRRATTLPIARDYATLMLDPCGAFERDFVRAMRDHGIDQPFVFAYTLPASAMVGAPDHAEVRRQIDEVLR